MRKLHEMIVLIRGGGATGSAIAQRLAHCHFRVCVTETENPSAIHRAVSLSDAIFDGQKIVEDITGEKCQANLEQIYKVWRNNHIPVIADPEINVWALLKPDVLINAMMLKRETNGHIKDAPLVLGIGPGFEIGRDVHLIVETLPGCWQGKVLLEGSAQVDKTDEEPSSDDQEKIVRAFDNGVFTTDRSIADEVKSGDVIGYLNDEPVTAPVSGILSGILRSETKVLANSRLAAVDPAGTKESCLLISQSARAIAGGVLEAIMLSLNVPEEVLLN